MRICFVGDSFVNGTGDPEYLGWTGRICRAARRKGLDITYYNLGIRRNTSADIAVRWLEEVSRRLPEECNGRVVFSFGVNDTTLEEGKTRINFQNSIENTSKILTEANPLFPVLMVSPPPVPDIEQNIRVAELSRQFDSVCRQLGVPYLDVFNPLQASTVWLKEAAANDGYHPGLAGYSELAKLVERWCSWLSWIE
ncbi:MAG: GDSL-type esterase/lipase family protein [Cyanobacteriota bacterium]|nr:GDSL-type esterase/lipase family protein [Cyanobacteriota bacterium]